MNTGCTIDGAIFQFACIIDTFSIVDVVEVIDADIYSHRWMGLGWFEICETYKFFQIYNPRWMYDYGWDWDRNRYRWVGWGANNIFHSLGEILHLNWCMHACLNIR